MVIKKHQEKNASSQWWGTGGRHWPWIHHWFRAMFHIDVATKSKINLSFGNVAKVQYFSIEFLRLSTPTTHASIMTAVFVGRLHDCRSMYLSCGFRSANKPGGVIESSVLDYQACTQSLGYYKFIIHLLSAASFVTASSVQLCSDCRWWIFWSHVVGLSCDTSICCRLRLKPSGRMKINLKSRDMITWCVTIAPFRSSC